jgi:transposase
MQWKEGPAVTTTMTYVGLDVHARSTHAAAIDVLSGELHRARFGGCEEAVAWLGELPQPLYACYEAGPTGFALYRAAVSAGLRVDVIAPSKTPRAPGDRVKTDRKDAELLARLLMAGQLRPVAVPPPEVEAARHLVRAREHLRQDLLRCRHRVSKLLLLHGRVYEGSTWTKTHHRWLEAQHFGEAATELAYLDALAAVGGLIARKSALDERLSRLTVDGPWAPTVARLRCFRGIDTLTALALCLEIGDFARFQRPAQLASWLGLAPSLNQSGESRSQGSITKTGSSYARRLLVETAWHYQPRPSLGRALAEPPRRTTRRSAPDRHARTPATAPPQPPPAQPRQTRKRRHDRRRTRARLFPLGGRPRVTTNHTDRCSGGRRATRYRHAR